MAELTQLQKLKIWLDISDEDTTQDNKLLLILDRAADKIKAKRNSPPADPMETRYNELQIQVALFLYNKLGAEGEKEHVENGVSRFYENADVPDSLMNDVVPLAKVIS